MGSRRQSREYALKMLFQIDIGQLEAPAVMNYFLSQQKGSEAVKAYAKDLTSGVLSELSAIDAMIQKQAHHWKLNRMAGIERNILRMAMYEFLRCPDVPKSVIINEAIEIAKKYSHDESGAFINGILDKLQLVG